MSRIRVYFILLGASCAITLGLLGALLVSTLENIDNLTRNAEQYAEFNRLNNALTLAVSALNDVYADIADGEGVEELERRRMPFQLENLHGQLAGVTPADVQSILDFLTPLSQAQADAYRANAAIYLANVDRLKARMDEVDFTTPDWPGSPAWQDYLQMLHTVARDVDRLENLQIVITGHFQDHIRTHLLDASNDILYLLLGLAAFGLLTAVLLVFFLRTHRAATRELAESQRLIAILAENTSDVIWTRNQNHELTYISPSCKKQLGYTPEELLEIPLLERIAPGSRALVERYTHEDREAIRRGDYDVLSRRFEMEVFHKQGGTVWMEVNMDAAFDQNGVFIGTAGSNRVITERKRAERALRASETRYRQLFESTQMGYALHEIIVDELGSPVDFRYLVVNPAFESIVGLSAAQVEDKTFHELFGTSDQSWVERYGRIALSGKPERFEAYFPQLDKHFDIAAFCPQLGQFAVTFQDITSRVRAQASLRDSEERFRQLVENINEAFWIHEADYSISYVSPQFEDIFGISMEVISADPDTFLARMHEDDRERVASARTSQWNTGGILDLTYRLRMPDGSQRWIHSRRFPIFDGAGRITRMVGVAENVTERHRLIDELQRSTQLAEAANESKSLFLANMSHELRTPLNGVMGMLQLLSKSELNANQQELAGYALDSCRKLLRLLSDILDLTRIESGKMSLESKAFDLRATIRDATEMFRDAAAVKDLGLSWRVPDEAPSTLVGDELRIRQILSNLVGNAVKFTTEGRIEVEANVLSVEESARSRLLLTVADTGIGIADEQLETIFQNFSQADESFTRTHQGAGLGLSIVKRLVNAMGGEVAVDTAIGQGATLYVTLPTTVAEAEAPAPEPAPAKPAEKEQPLRILLVEDEVINSLAARKLLERLGHAVVHAPDGLRAVEAVQESGDFDLVLMDIQMPGIDGVEATRRIRERGFTAPIAAMTAYAMAGDRERFLDAGMDDYLAKPIEIDDLRALLARLGRPPRGRARSGRED